MSLAELLAPELETEMKVTRRVLERVPGKPSWKPHDKSMTLGRLATLTAELPDWMVNALVRDEYDIAPPGGPPLTFPVLETAKVLELFDANVSAARRALERTTDAQFAEPWTLKFGGRHVSTQPRLMVYRTSLNHLVHHRGQLTVYLRLNDVPVPSVYGPSADEQRF